MKKNVIFLSVLNVEVLVHVGLGSVPRAWPSAGTPLYMFYYRETHRHLVLP